MRYYKANPLLNTVLFPPPADHSLPSSGSAPCMFGVPSPFTSQDALLSQQRVQSSSDVQDLVSSLPPINTVFMGAGGVQ